MNYAANISRGPGAGRAVVLLALSLLSASVALLVGVMTGLNALTLLSTGPNRKPPPSH